MKKHKFKNFFKVKVYLLSIIFLSVTAAYGYDILSNNISIQTSSGIGSNGSRTSITNIGSGLGSADYWNTGNNSTIIGNTFKGFYYDSILGFFKLDWSTNSNENVQIISSTSACSSGYGYKLGGYAYSDYFGYIDFDYNSNVFVYYCIDDSSLHGFAYSKYLGFQNFEGISFNIIPEVSTLAENTSTGIFVNDTTKINNNPFWDGNINTFIGGDTVNLDDDKESIFYIIK